MSNQINPERFVQNRLISLFQDKLGYSYLGNWEKREDNQPIETELLKKYLESKQYNNALITKAMYELQKAADVQNKNLYDANKEVYTLLRYGVQVKAEQGDNNDTVWLIDWEHPGKNNFSIAEEVTVRGQFDKRPDLVLYINGIAIVVIELKRSTVSVSEGIRQNLDNQKEVFIRQFFSTVQLVMAGNDSEGLRYGVIETPEKYYLKWKEKGEPDCTLDSHIMAMCNKERLLELIHDFIVFDRGVKKICRHNQFNAVKASQIRIRNREGGIIWHTQGSGKSLIMVWLAKWIIENITGSRVLTITDRDELDKQIEKVFKGVNEQIVRTKSGADMIDRLNASEDWLICSLIHKFGNKEEGDYQGYIEEIKRTLPKNFKAKGDIYVFVDECHRTQSGDLHKAMKAILPEAMFIGFTGTPLLKTDKKTSLEIFGRNIDTYKYDEAVFDKAIVDLRYEARDIDQRLTSQDKIDTWFDSRTSILTPIAQARLKQRWGTMQKVLSSRNRLEKIVNDILYDMEVKDRLQSGKGNAMLVAGSIFEACKYYQLFIEHGFTKCAIITSYVPHQNDLKGQATGEDEESDDLQQYGIYQKMLNGKSTEKFEEEVKKQFIEEPGQMKLLIVVDKLLTGFDAPSATYLYIDKKMQDHGLFQAICRVNRIDSEDKEYGYIIDYKDLFKSLETAVNDYTSGAFDNYNADDVRGLLCNRLDKAKEHLDEVMESIKALCEPVLPPKEEKDYIHYFCGNTEDKDDLKANEQKRLTLYKTTAKMLRAYAEVAGEMKEAGYSDAEAEQIIKDIDYYEKVRKVIMLASGEWIDLKSYEAGMRHLIDTYIQADDSVKISAFDDLGLIELIVQRGESAIDSLPDSIKKNKEAVAETIENNVRKLIIDEMKTNPKYYGLMSTLLDELIKQRKRDAIEYQIYLQEIIELTKLVNKPDTSDRYTARLNTGAKRALFDNLNENEEVALALDNAIVNVKKADWRGNLMKEREIRREIRKFVPEEEELNRIFELVKNQQDY